MAKVIKILNGFFLRTTKKDGTAPLYLSIRKGGVAITVSTSICVDIKEWSSAIQKTNKWNEYIITNEGNRVNELMKHVQAGVDKLIESGVTNKEEYVKLFRRIVNYREYDDNKKSDKDRREHIIAFYNYFIESIESGLIKHKELRYKRETIKRWREFYKVLSGFSNPFDTFNDIDKMYSMRFKKFLEDRGYLKQTINDCIGKMRKLCRVSAELGFNNNPASLNVWQAVKVDKCDVRASIYLSEEEINSLYEMKLKGQNEKARDIFILGYLSFQRFSDYSNIGRDNFKKNDAGVPVISLTQKKTGNYVEIPIVDKRVYEICEKYNYNIPKMIRGNLGECMKNILKKLSNTVPSLKEMYVTTLSVNERKSEENYLELRKKRMEGKKLTANETHSLWLHNSRAYDRMKGIYFYRNEKGEVMKPKYLLVNTHTSRRSSITNAYKLGIFDSRELMSLSGHSTEKIMLEYIKVGTSEQARRVYEKMLAAQDKQKKKAEIIKIA